MTKSILVPVDFSEQSLIAVEQSYNLAKLFKAKIVIINVIRTHSSMWKVFGAKEKLDIESKIQLKLEELVDNIKSETGLQVEYLLKKGKVVEQIIETAKILKPAFIVSATSGSKNIRQKVIGSRTLSLIKRTNIPIVIIKGKHHRKLENIVLPLDLSKETKQKVKLTKEIAKIFKAKVFVVSLIDNTKQNVIEESELQMLQVKKELIEANIECETELLNSPLKDKESMALKLLSFAYSVDADLISIMTQQENNIKSYFIGSMAQYVMHLSDIPVLAIKPTKETDNQ